MMATMTKNERTVKRYHFTKEAIFAECDDGTLWAYSVYRYVSSPWTQIKPVPGRERVDGPTVEHDADREVVLITSTTTVAIEVESKDTNLCSHTCAFCDTDARFCTLFSVGQVELAQYEFIRCTACIERFGGV